MIRALKPIPQPSGPPLPRGVAIDDILAAVAHRFRAYDLVGPEEVMSVIDVSREQAELAEAWARFHGAWPYLRPTPTEGHRP